MAPPLTYPPVVGVIIIVSMVIEVGKRNEKLLLMLWSEIFKEKDEFPQLFQRVVIYEHLTGSMVEMMQGK